MAIETTPRTFARIAAQTVKQVIMQSIRDAEPHSSQVEYTGPGTAAPLS